MTSPSSAAQARIIAFACIVLHLWSAAAHADRTLEVGPGHPFSRIEEALARAGDGDIILVHPREGGIPYERVALLVRTPHVKLIAVPSAAQPHRISLRGEGFEYSGKGPTPRAIVQVDPGADGFILDGFELSGARNKSHNGAGVRINQANHVTIRSCHIHDNDMGVMSNGGDLDAASDQYFEFCLIHSNGSHIKDGMSHNLYLGGTSAVLSACEVHTSTSGNNIKSRAHYTRIEYCWVHDSANRELDLVDEPHHTDRPESDAIVLGCILSKAADMRGNRAVIHFGQDGGADHTGTLTIANSTIITPYVTPVVTLSAPGARVTFANNLFTDGGSGQHNQVLVGIADPPGGPPREERIASSDNALRGDFLDAEGVRLSSPVRFANAAAGDFQVIAPDEALRRTGRSIESLALRPAPGRAGDHPGVPLQRYAHPQSLSPRRDDTAPGLGAWPAPNPSLPAPDR